MLSLAAFRSAVCAVLLASNALAGSLYLSGSSLAFPGQTAIVALDTGANSVVNSWTTVDPSELSFAIGSTIRTFSRDGGFGSGAEYTLNGAPTGTTYDPLSSLFGFVLLVDGTQDATHNYTVDGIFGNVYSFDRNWGGGAVLFTLPAPAGSLWTGVTYDATNNSIWATDFLNSSIADFALDGTPLSSFTTAAPFPSSLALDPTDQTLWTASGLGAGLDQYAKDGTHLQTLTNAGLNLNIGGMEFAPVDTPEPAAFGLAALGMAALIAVRIRVSSRAGSR
jgi:hypothetical protein